MRMYPYGLADFHRLRQQGYFYADRTGLIPAIERAGIQLIFLRPRRFGKSLLMSMLANYYDVNRADEFDELFGDLAIGANPTPLHNQYFVLRWDFSKVLHDRNPRVIQENLFRYINSKIADFYNKYSDFVSPREIDPTNAIISFEYLLTAISKSSYKLYVMIDEYDNFANAVAMSQDADQDVPARVRYEDLIIGEGSLKTFFAALKAAVGEGRLDRIFVTGVAPMVLSDMTSGFNTAENVSFLPQLSQLCGFTELEIQTELAKLCPNPDELLNQMRLLYNGYSFHPDRPDERLYHPTLSLYFLKHLAEQGTPPTNPLDTNLQMDADKLAWFSQVAGGSAMLETLSTDEKPLEVTKIGTQFRLQDLVEKTIRHDDLAILITYFGMATLAGTSNFARPQLRIPNTVIRSLYIDELRQRLIPNPTKQQEGKTIAESVFETGDIAPVCEWVEHHVLPAFSNRDYRYGEATVKAAFMTAIFNDTQYLPISEATIGRRYADAVFLVKPQHRHSGLKDILIEFKYLSLTDLKMDAQHLKQLTREQLLELPAVQEKLAHARAQRNDYAESLRHDYPDAKLNTYTILALGFERLLWETG